MKRLIVTLLAVGVLAVGGLTIVWVYQAQHSYWLSAYLVLGVFLPLLAGMVALNQGRPGFKNLVQTLFAVASGLVVMSLVYQWYTHSWVWACLAGLVVPVVVSGVQGWKVAQARLALNQAIAAYNDDKYKEALRLALDARTAFVSRNERDGQADAEYIAGASSVQLGDRLRGTRYVNRALAHFRARNNKDQIGRAEHLLAQLRQVGVDTEASAVSEDEEHPGAAGIDWRLLFNGAMAIAGLAFFARLWDVAAARASIGVTVFAGVALFLYVFGQYAVVALAGARTDARVGRSLVLLNVFFLVSLAAAAGWLLRSGTVRAENFFPAVQGAAAGLQGIVARWPGWALAVATAVGGLACILTLLAASGRTPREFVGGLWMVDINRKSLELARGHLDEREWGKAIAQLNRIDLETEKDPARRAEVLFYLGFAHLKADRAAEAQQYAGEVLSIDGRHREGLYLAGYLALNGGRLDDAETFWRRLCEVAPDFAPVRSGHRGRSAKHYLSVSLYMKAMAAADVEAASTMLGEVSRLGALDKEVADALVRVHLQRFAHLHRRHDWQGAAREAEAAEAKLQHLQPLVSDPKEIATIRGCCHAAKGLLALRLERDRQAVEDFDKAIDAVKTLRPRRVLGGSGNSLLEQLLKSLMEAQAEKDTIHPNFLRDTALLGGIAELHVMAGEAGKRGFADKAAHLRERLEEALTADPSSAEAKALLGLLYYYLGPEEDTREKGLEALQAVRERIGSKFVSDTLAAAEAEKQQMKDACEAYFELLQQYVRSSDVPLRERKNLRDEVLRHLKASGQYESLVGGGFLEIQGEEEPSVQEYAQRAAVLRVKMDQILKSRRLQEASGQLGELMADLEKRHASLKETIESIAGLEKKILHEAKVLL